MNYSRIEEIAAERGYFVDRQGNLHSPTRGLITPALGSTGYPTTLLRLGNRKKHLTTHRLQAYQKFGAKIYENGMVVRHLDGNPKNNSYANIEIGTQRDNNLDIPREVRLRTAIYATSFMTKYDKETVERIKEFKKTHSYKETMREFGISSKGTLWNILNKR